MIGVIDIKVAAHNPNFPLEPVFTFINSAQSFRIRNVPRAVGKWNITKVFVRLVYPDNTTIQKECVLNGNIWIGTVEGCAESGTSTNGFIVTASGIDENENIITNYVLGAGDLYVKDLDGTIDPQRVGTKMYFNDALPENPKKGDATFIDQTLNVYDGANWVPVAVSPDPSFIIDADGNKICADRTVEVVEQGTPFWNLVDGDSNEYQMTGTKINSKWESASEKYELLMPNTETDGWTLKYYTKLASTWLTKWNETILEPQSATTLEFPTHGFTATWDDARTVTEDELALKSDLPTKTSDLTNDSGFITSADVPTKTSDLTNDSGFITSADLPTKTSDLTNDSKFITSDEVEPYHEYNTPTTPTGLAYKARMLIGTESGKLDTDAAFRIQVNRGADLIPVVNAISAYNTYHPWNMAKFFEQTYSPELKLIYVYGKIAKMMGSRPRTMYTGYMFRTATAPGFAMPCDEEGTPNGTLYEIDTVQIAYVAYHDDSQVHTVEFDDYSHNSIATIDGQEDQVTCSRASAYKTYGFNYTFATQNWVNEQGFITAAQVPTKTSDLTNDSGFITSADIITKRDYTDFNIYVRPNSTTTIYVGSSACEWNESSQRWESEEAFVTPPETPQSNTYFVMSGGMGDDVELAPPQYTGVIHGDYSDIPITCSPSDTIAKTSQIPQIPTKTSDLTNDSGFITSADIPAKSISFTIKQDKGLYNTSLTITVKTSPTKTLTVVTNPNGSGGTFVANFLISGWSDSTTLADVVTAPDTAGCYVFKTSGQLNDTWGNLKSTLISTAESFEIALPL